MIWNGGHLIVFFSGGFNADAMMGAIVKLGDNVAVTVENSVKELDLNTKVFTHQKKIV
jgi:hypothetical protein